jgi:hypothetical protein
MGRQFVPVGVGVGIMPVRENRFWDRVMGRVRERVRHRVVPGILKLSFPVLAGVRLCMGRRIPGPGFVLVSR